MAEKDIEAIYGEKLAKMTHEDDEEGNCGICHGPLGAKSISIEALDLYVCQDCREAFKAAGGTDDGLLGELISNRAIGRWRARRVGWLRMPESSRCLGQNYRR